MMNKQLLMNQVLKSNKVIYSEIFEMSINGEIMEVDVNISIRQISVIHKFMKKKGKNYNPTPKDINFIKSYFLRIPSDVETSDLEVMQVAEEVGRGLSKINFNARNLF